MRSMIEGAGGSAEERGLLSGPRSEHEPTRALDTMDFEERGAASASAWLAALLVATAIGTAVPWVTVAHAGPSRGAVVSQERLRDSLREHVLRALDGETLPLASLRGEVVVVNFWASWCRPCGRELKTLDVLHRELAKQGGRVVAISIDEDSGNVRRFVRRHALAMPVYLDGPDGLARRIDLDRIPFTVLLDRRGEIALTTSGADERALAHLDAVARRLIATKPLSAASQGETP